MHTTIRGLDGIRAVAVAVVVLHHTWLPVGHGGYLGVDMFFVLSGFLITTLLLRERESTGSVGLRRFYARRALRLYPALVLMVVGFAPWALTLAPDRQPREYLDGALASLTYTMDLTQVLGHPTAFSHTWSLAVEEQFYLVWPALLLWLMARGTHTALRVALGLAVVQTVLYAIFSNLAATSGPITSFNPLTRPSGLFLGCALALAIAHGGLVGRRRHAAVGLAGVLATFVAAWLWPSDRLQMLYIPLACSSTAALILGLRVEGPVRTFLELAPLRWLGRRSYGLYLLHLPIFGIVASGTDLATPLRILLEVSLSVGACAASYRFVEQPFLRLKRRFAAPAPPSVAASGARASGSRPTVPS